METVEVNVEVREELKKNKIKKLRNEFKVPAILYGNTEPTPVTITKKDIESILKLPKGINTPLTLKFKQDNKEVSQKAITYNITRDPLTQFIKHIDFMTLEDKKAVKVKCTVNPIGNAPGVKAGGVFIIKSKQLKIKTIPSLIPAKLDVDISTLEVGTDLRVKDLKVTDGVELLDHPQTVIIRIEAPRIKAEDIDATSEIAATDNAEGNSESTESTDS